MSYGWNVLIRESSDLRPFLDEIPHGYEDTDQQQRCLEEDVMFLILHDGVMGIM